MGRIVNTELPNLVPQRRIDDCCVIIFRFSHDCSSTSSARGPRYFRLQADVAIWVFRKVSADTVLARTRFHFCSRLHWLFMRRTGSVSMSRRRVSPWLQRTTFIDQMFSDLLQPVWHAINCCLLLRVLYFVFSVSVGLCTGFPRSSSLVLPLLSGTGFSASRLTSNTESCDEDVEDVGVGVVEELVD